MYYIMSVVMILRCDAVTTDVRGYCTVKYVAMTDDIAQAYMVAITDGWACRVEGDFCPEHADNKQVEVHRYQLKT